MSLCRSGRIWLLENIVSIFKVTDSDQEIQLAMNPVMDLTVAEELRLGFLDCLSRGKTIKIMTGDVERITTPCLQVLFAMKTTTSEQNIAFLFPEMSEAFQKALKDVGLTDQFITSEHTA